MIWFPFCIAFFPGSCHTRYIVTIQRFFSYRDRGFTLMELLIVISILILILMMVFVNLQTQIARAHDSKRKTDLNLIQKALEDYYDDTLCYPANGIFSACGGTQFQPYMRTIPCDPVSKTSYLYGTDVANSCAGYHLCAKLEDLHDPDITRLGCDPVQGCGWGAGYNYCISMGGIIPGSPTPPPGQFACSPSGACNLYVNLQANGCPAGYGDATCHYNGVDLCADPANRCQF
ncbi:hypothetical protein A2Z00_03870 [Candidatus Gottesmanbacteria bacterium RBG_13_45_10]|uniref:Type II secretion system protein GspG C-terminal domain-containing protein n=1 Tax=Candidatus Gottesmanbacteria bacterium RBG_13_45_10 TaxID=1798370 RepID=A0A1F5ZHS6_9BACT|nr:MAG: hypothetical protein A2Z00_03870 [Candidatus Gottesmanbacteria bacterium RBG_13_45_10]